MDFVFYDKKGEELDLILNILKQEGIRPRLTKNVDVVVNGWIGVPICYESDCSYDVVINTDLQHYDFLNFIINQELKKQKKFKKKLSKLEKCFNSPSYNPNKSDKSKNKKSTTNPTIIVTTSVQKGIL